MKKYQALAFGLILCWSLNPFALAELERKKEDGIESYFQKWLNQDVVYIITAEEKAVFEKLTTVEEKERFIEQFWLRRDPDPSTPENEFKIEHYRRIQYANEKFSAGVPGWKTDRGMIYIKYGPPDTVESHEGGETYIRPTYEGGGTTSVYPFEVWRYQYIEGVGPDVEIEFVDKVGGGLYEMARDEHDKDALFYTPGGLTRLEALGLADKARRVERRYAGNPDEKYFGQNRLARSKDLPFERLVTRAQLGRPPEIKYRDLKSIVTAKLSYHLLPFALRYDLIRAGKDFALVPVTIEINNSDLSYRKTAEGIEQATVNLYALVQTIGGKIAYEFEDTIASNRSAGKPGKSLYQKSLPLRPGRYKLSLVVKDITSGKIGTIDKGIVVPEFGAELASSSIILADRIKPARPDELLPDPFVMEGGLKIYPNVSGVFSNNQIMGVYFEVYNLNMDQAGLPSLPDISYVLFDGNGRPLEAHLLSQSPIKTGIVGDKVVVTKFISLKGFSSGEYRLKFEVVDKISGRKIFPEAKFKVAVNPGP